MSANTPEWVLKGLESDNAKLRAINAELLGFIKEQLVRSKAEKDFSGLTVFDEVRAEDLIAKAEDTP